MTLTLFSFALMSWLNKLVCFTTINISSSINTNGTKCGIISCPNLQSGSQSSLEIKHIAQNISNKQTLQLTIHQRRRKGYNIDTCGKFQKHFMIVTYGRIKISQPVHCKHDSMQRFQTELAYFAAALSYDHKMFMKLAPGLPRPG